MMLVSSLLWYIIGRMGISTYGIEAYFEQSRELPLLFFLNFAPILTMMLLLFFISKQALFAATVTSVIFLLPAYINRVKILVRNDPFLPADITLVREVLALVEDYALRDVIFAGAALLLAILFIVFCFKKWKGTVLSIYVRIAGIVLILVSGVVSYQTLYSSPHIFGSFERGGYLPANNYAHLGFVYHFIHDMRFLSIPTPPDYDRNEILALENEPIPPLPEGIAKPHIIIIQGEAFSDIPLHAPMEFLNGIYPLENFQRIAAESVVSGHLIVDTFGAGTIRPELSVLTGHSFADLPVSSPSQYIRTNRDSIAWQLRELGYFPRALHPGNSWFYNRYNVYRHLGFHEFLSIETSFDITTQGRGDFISEEATFDVLLETLRHHLDNYDEPLFQYLITIQNHGPYLGRFFPEWRELEFTIDVDLSEDELDILHNYLEGLLDQDLQMARLTAYLEALDEPFILVYFSDHNPQLFRNADILEAQTPYEVFIAMHRIPYFIWANTAALEQTDILENARQANIQADIPYSVFHLAPMLMELLGFHQRVPFYSFIVELRHIAPVINSANMDGFYMDKEGNFSRTPFEGTAELLALYHRWSYFKLTEYFRPTA